ncbi:hypothetical protein AU106_gp021 [Sinorhizobium phage phiM9]|uniref:Uncharacterized protein n=1 Tax=Sinorhizobium phage phiM9 TaxID=1636182 RepID=A0A0F6R4U9_9CAUD|nr:hypothetical protein AU106_gp021 [Sinorhizobium phage phiM9]AKE44652.1 hypothetical protein Sm_phiM9_022 [Sinorhizobium phage phiM9]
MDYKARAVCFRDFDRPDVGAVCYLQPEPATWQTVGLAVSLAVLIPLIVYIIYENIKNRNDTYCSWR